MTKPIRFDLPDLQLFIAAAETGSLSKAAARLPLALSAASARLRKLEARLGVMLFERHASGLTLSKAGRSLLEHARRIERAAQDAQAAIDGHAGKQRALLRVWANTTANSTVLPAALGGFLLDHPYLDVALNERPSREVVQAVLNGDADLGVIDGDYDAGDLLCLPLAHYRMVGMAPAHHALLAQESCLFRDLARHPMVGQPEDSSMQRFIEKMADVANIDLHIRARVASFAAIANLVNDGVGIAIVPESIGRSYRDSLGLALLPISDGWASRELKVCIREWEYLSPAVRALATCLGKLG
ncbi:LysR family transcriptional regulator [Chitinimonas sp.]|uniref:LysR family transcriptional regulator n=1 Tax=Chitinimonas sp. TaxID=1934313 RepID=UPI0035B0B598